MYKCIVYESETRGHRGVYLSAMKLARPDMELVQGKNFSSLYFTQILRAVYAAMSLISCIFKSKKGVKIIVPTADGLVYVCAAICILMPNLFTKCVFILHRATYLEVSGRWWNWIAHLFLKIAMKGLSENSIVCLVSDRSFEIARAIGHNSVLHFPDPFLWAIELDKTVSSRLQRRAVILFAGLIDERKGVLEFLSWISNGEVSASVICSFEIVLAGVHSRGVSDFLSIHKFPFVVSVDRKLSDLEFSCFIKESHIVCVNAIPYPGISSVLLHALNNRVPVMSVDNCWSADYIKRYEIGVVFNYQQKFESVLGLILSFRSRFQAGIDQNIGKIKGMHSFERFKCVIDSFYD